VLLFLIKAAILGAIQGLSEFLPISSSGHLVIVQHLFRLEEPEVFFDLFLHLGTLSAVVYFYRTEVFGMLSELKQLASPKRLSVSYKTRPLFRLGVLVVIGSLPTALIGLLFEDYLTALFSDIMAVGINLFITASLLFFSALCKRTTIHSELEFPALLAFYIGVAQGIAIAPGLSRSGVTIALAIILGCDRILAARYSFLLSIPAILGGLILKFSSASQSDFPMEAMATGFLVAAITGYLCLKLLSLLLEKDRFHIFAPWCVLAGLVAIYLSYFPLS
jgi:undecaprenyl-diphosphatase